MDLQEYRIHLPQSRAHTPYRKPIVKKRKHWAVDKGLRAGFAQRIESTDWCSTFGVKCTWHNCSTCKHRR